MYNEDTSHPLPQNDLNVKQKPEKKIITRKENYNDFLSNFFTVGR